MHAANPEKSEGQREIFYLGILPGYMCLLYWKQVFTVDLETFRKHIVRFHCFRRHGNMCFYVFPEMETYVYTFGNIRIHIRFHYVYGPGNINIYPVYILSRAKPDKNTFL